MDVKIIVAGFLMFFTVLCGVSQMVFNDLDADTNDTFLKSALQNACNGIDSCEQKKPVYHILNDYYVLRKVGTGMIGRVYLVRHKATDQEIALKIMPKQKILELKQYEHVKNEKRILSELHFPFIVSMYSTANDREFIYIFLEYVPGGELYKYLKHLKKFDEVTSKFYISEVICALSYLHSLSIIYRDLKPENILLDKDGHLKLVDFGFSKKVAHSTWTLCGTPKYLAPEIILSKAYTKAVDWWTVGILIFEMLTGNPPFNDASIMDVYRKIVNGRIEWPDEFPNEPRDLIRSLLVRDPRRRLGSSRNGSQEVKRHHWFRSLSWGDVMDKKIKPPIIPVLEDDQTKPSSNASVCIWQKSVVNDSETCCNEKSIFTSF